MTRFLSESLNANEPYFRLGLRQLEAASGNPSTDIRLSNEIKQASKTKILGLGLDPDDTTPNELYEALKQKLKDDDKLLTKKLRTLAASYVSAEAEPTAGMIEAINRLSDSKRCYSLKLSKLKRILKTLPPKKAMKRLNYRSIDSMLKHERPVLILAAAYLCESSHWQKQLVSQYKKLGPLDFEDRQISLLRPSGKRWEELASEVVNQNKHNLLCFKELGSVVFLPLNSSDSLRPGIVTASLALALHELNEIRACSTYLKLNQTKSDFGLSVYKVALAEPELGSNLLNQPISWSLVQRYYARLNDKFREDIFEPYVHLEDMVWNPIEKTLAAIEPSFEFWSDSTHLGIIHEGQPVSLNLLDSALNLCNLRSFEERIVNYFQTSLHSELLLRYLKHEPLERSLISELQPELAMETVSS
jgi:hypothetical protein